MTLWNTSKDDILGLVSLQIVGPWYDLMPEHRKHVTVAWTQKTRDCCLKHRTRDCYLNTENTWLLPKHRKMWPDAWTQKHVTVSWTQKTRDCDLQENKWLLPEHRKHVTVAWTKENTWLLPEHRNLETVAWTQKTHDCCLNTENTWLMP